MRSWTICWYLETQIILRLSLYPCFFLPLSSVLTKLNTSRVIGDDDVVWYTSADLYCLIVEGRRQKKAPPSAKRKHSVALRTSFAWGFLAQKTSHYENKQKNPP